MSDINLLPTDQREKELKEIQQKFKEKSRSTIEMTGPAKKQKTVEKTAGFLFKIKKGLNGIKQAIKLPKRTKPTVAAQPSQSPQQPPAQIPKHIDNIQVNKPSKKFVITENTETTQRTQKPAITEDTETIQRTQSKISESSEKSSEPSVLAGKKIQSPQRDSEPSVLAGKLTQIEPAPQSQAERLKINLIPSKIKDLLAFKKKIVILIMVIAVCLFVGFGCYWWLSSQVANRQAELAKLESDKQELGEQINNLKTANYQVVEFLALLKQVKKLVQEHIFATHVFDLLQSQTSKQIYYDHLDVDTQNRSVNLTANARDFRALAEQMLIFQSLEEIISIKLSAVALEEQEGTGSQLGMGEKQELVTFNIDLELSPEFFNKH